MVRLKEQFLNSKIYVPAMNSFQIGKFIPQGVLEKMSDKYPELFERIDSKSEEIPFEVELEEKLQAMEPKKKSKKNEEID